MNKQIFLNIKKCPKYYMCNFQKDFAISTCAKISNIVSNSARKYLSNIIQISISKLDPNVKGFMINCR